MNKRTVLLAAAAAAMAALSIVVFVLLRSGDAEMSFDPETALDLGIVMESDGVWTGTAQFLIAPAIGGDEQVVVSFEPRENGVAVKRFDLQLTGLTSGETVGPVSIETPSGIPSDPFSLTLPGQQFWQIDLTARPESGPSSTGTATFLLPDPNLNGNDQVETHAADPAAAALFDLGSARLTSLHRVAYRQSLTDGSGLAVVSYHRINDGDDGSLPGFTYQTPGGLDAVVIGTDLWSRTGDEPWKAGTTNALIPPSEWMDEYTGATGFVMGPAMTYEAGTCQMVTFVVPEAKNRSIAWYAWCVDPETGDLLRDDMVSRNHYMTSEFAEFDDEIRIEKPVWRASADVLVELSRLCQVGTTWREKNHRANWLATTRKQAASCYTALGFRSMFSRLDRCWIFLSPIHFPVICPLPGTGTLRADHRDTSPGGTFRIL